jgi:Mg2+ and Co2+ transporter CorA
VQDAGAVYDLIEELQVTTLSRITSQELAMLPLAIAHLQELSNVFEASLDKMVSSSTLWGALYLVIKVPRFLNRIPRSLKEELTFVQMLSTSETAFHRLSRMLKILGRKAELFNGFSKRSPDVKELKEGAVEIQMEILEFLTHLITHFRTESFGESLYSSLTPVLGCG